MSILNAAVALADTTDHAHTATSMVGRCAATGLAAASYRSVIAAAVTLGMTACTATGPWRNDIDFINALVDLEAELSAQASQIRSMIADCEERLALVDEHTPTDYVVALQAALEILYAALRRVEYATNRLMAAPDELGDTYAAAYSHIRSGRKLPYRGRFISGDVPA
ncbi:hypothetical protein ACIBG4_40875 [Nonomuraea sp. NPDC050383]|uniref:hypothetical protein n=1 Tax=Nonomuraea sp. NPDC050383 TaxID=3364362 RepID=UPI0037AE8937